MSLSISLNRIPRRGLFEKGEKVKVNSQAKTNNRKGEKRMNEHVGSTIGHFLHCFLVHFFQKRSQHWRRRNNFDYGGQELLAVTRFAEPKKQKKKNRNQMRKKRKKKRRRNTLLSRFSQVDLQESPFFCLS
jgi:hypothetical protein